MDYFRLRDDLHVPRRWHLGDVTRDGKDLKVFLDAGKPVGKAAVNIAISQSGAPLDFTLTTFNIPVVTPRLASIIATFVGGDHVEWVPATISGNGEYRVANLLQSVACVDEHRSEFEKWTTSDFRSDKAGEYKSFAKLALNTDAITPAAHLFRLWGYRVVIVVSEALKDEITAAGYTGVAFDKF